MKNLLITAHPYPVESLFAGPTYKKHACEETIQYMLPSRGLPAFEPDKYSVDTNDIKELPDGNKPTYKCNYRNILAINGNKKYDAICAIDGHPAPEMQNILEFLLNSYSDTLKQCVDKEHNKHITDFTIQQIIDISKIHLGELVKSYVNIMSDDSWTFIGKVSGITIMGSNTIYIQLNKVIPIRASIIDALNDMFAKQTIKPGCKITVSTNGLTDYEEKNTIEAAKIKHEADAAAAFAEYSKWYAKYYPLLIIRVEPLAAGGRQRPRSKRAKSKRTKSKRAKSRGRR
jgi:hypothetical protein